MAAEQEDRTVRRPERGSGRRAGCLAWLAGAVALFALLVLLVFLLRAPLLRGYADLFTVSDPLGRADVIFLLNGSVDDRPFTAAQLHREGWAPRIVLAQAEAGPAARLGVYPTSSGAAVTVLRALGIPDSAIVVLDVPGGAGSTYAEAVALRDHFRSTPAETAILVTSPFHTRRARWVFRRVVGDGGDRLIMRPARHNQRYDESTWWHHESGLIEIFQETVKYVYYRWNYGR